MAFWLVNTVITWLNNEISWDLGLIETHKLEFCLKKHLLKLQSLISCEISGDLVKETLIETLIETHIGSNAYWNSYWNSFVAMNSGIQ